MFFELAGFTARNGSKVSPSVQFAGGPGNPVSQSPTAFGRDNSISGPSVELWALARNPIMPATAMPTAKPNVFSAAGRVTDWVGLLVSSSNLLFILFLWFLLVVPLVFSFNNRDRVAQLRCLYFPFGVQKRD